MKGDCHETPAPCHLSDDLMLSPPAQPVETKSIVCALARNCSLTDPCTVPSPGDPKSLS